MADHKDNSVGVVETRKARLFEDGDILRLQCGKTLSGIDVAYETYGSLNATGDNVVLICHALSGNAHVAGTNKPEDKKPGWWDIMVGPGKGIDTDKYFVICSNILGGCSGTTGPSSVNLKTGKPYGLDFPVITIADMVSVQKALLDKLGIKQILCVIGGSMGGMQVLQWTIDYTDFVKSAVVIASTAKLSAQSIAFDAVGRNAILGDANFNNGRYTAEKGPNSGLSIARMIGHITYLSEQGMREKFGRELKADGYKYEFDSEFSVETYLAYQGQSFVERFDANSYLYITKAMDYFDLEREYGSLAKAFAGIRSKFLVISFASDWLFTPAQSEEIAGALVANDVEVSYCNVDSPYGHDAFLLEPETLGKLLSGFIAAVKEPAVRVEKISLEKPSLRKLRKNPDHDKRVRIDYKLIESLIRPNSSVLDVGCGDGELLASLSVDKHVTGEGIEIDQGLIIECVRRGRPALQRDIERGLEFYEDKRFDYAILSQTVQTVKNPEKVLKELLRVARKVIVSFPNFGHWKVRAMLMLTGKAPVTKKLPFGWYDTPNIHCLSLKDFEEFCDKVGARIEKKMPLTKSRIIPASLAPNLLAEQAVYLIEKR